MPIGFTGSMWITGSLNINGVDFSPVSRSYAITASHNSSAISSASNALIKTGSAVELGGFMYRNTPVTGTLENTVDFSFTTSGSGIKSGSNNGILYAVDKDSLGRIYVGGTAFNSYKGTPVGSGIIRVFEDGTADLSFNVGTGIGVLTGFYGIYSIKVDPATDKIYIGGRFTSYSGSAVGHVLRLNTDGTIDTSFNTGVGFTGTTNTYGPYVRSLDLDSNGKVICGGAWTGYSGSSVGNGLARLNTDGTYDTTFDVGVGVSANSFPGVGTEILKVRVEPGTNKVYFSGQFNNYSGSSGYSGLLKVNPDGTIDNTFNSKPGLAQPPGSPFATGYISYIGGSMLIDKDLNIYLVGLFYTFNTTGSNGIIKLNSSGAIDTSFNYGSGFFYPISTYNYGGAGSVFSVDQYNRFYYYGPATTYSGSVISGSVRILQNGTIDQTFNKRNRRLSNYSSTISKDNKSIYIVGNFTSGFFINEPSDPSFVKVNIVDPELSFTKTQLVYASDYSQFYTSRSLVDKGYVDTRLTGSLYPTGTLSVTGSALINSYITLAVRDPLPTTNLITGSFMSSGSGADNKPYYWNGNSWTAMI